MRPHDPSPALPDHGHDPVLVAEVLRLLDPRPGQTIMDCTLGRGGHALQIIEKLAPAGTLIGLDVDPENLKFARHRLEAAAATQSPPTAQIRTFHANFAEADDVLAELQIPAVDGLLADFGISTNQLFDQRHGLSFNADLPLDMRLDPRIRTKASDLLANWSDAQIADALHDLAQERFAWRIARKIVQTRTTQPITSTGQLARLVRSVVPARYGQIDPATRTFQALRMAVNSEIESIDGLLAAVPHMLKPGGRAVFISFHSGEDRLIKHAVRRWAQDGRCTILTKKPVEPTEEEMQRNPRSRSAKLRAVTWKV